MAGASARDAEEKELGWIELIGPAYRLATVTLGLSIMLHAVNFFIFATLAPSVIADLGELERLHWATTLFVVASIVGSAAGGRVRARIGAAQRPDAGDPRVRRRRRRRRCRARHDHGAGRPHRAGRGLGPAAGQRSRAGARSVPGVELGADLRGDLGGLGRGSPCRPPRGRGVRGPRRMALRLPGDAAGLPGALPGGAAHGAGGRRQRRVRVGGAGPAAGPDRRRRAGDRRRRARRRRPHRGPGRAGGGAAARRHRLGATLGGAAVPARHVPAGHRAGRRRHVRVLHLVRDLGHGDLRALLPDGAARRAAAGDRLRRHRPVDVLDDRGAAGGRPGRRPRQPDHRRRPAGDGEPDASARRCSCRTGRCGRPSPRSC